MIKNNQVKALWRADKPAFGTWITLCPHLRVVKILATTGFDFVLIEMEHTDFTMETVGSLTMYARECGLTPIVRPPGTMKPHDLTRPLDAGAQGLLLPMIETAEQLAALISQTKYYPLGNRPINLKGPHTDYFIAPPSEVIAHLNRETLTIAMIESRKGLDNLDEILGVQGLDCIMIGPDDLSQDLGVPGDLKAKVLHEAYEHVFSLCAKHSIPYGLSAQSPEMAADWFAKGCRWIPYQNDASMIFNAANAVVPKLRALGGR